MKKTILLSLILTAIFSFAIISNAQQTKTISEEKNRLIAELIVLTKADQQVVEITDSMLAAMEKNQPVIIEQALASNPDLTENERAELKEKLTERFQSFSKRFRERLPKEIDYPGFIRDVMYPLYDKYFTVNELKDLVAFYRTDTGQKVIMKMPQLFSESQEMSQKILLPQVLQLVDKILKEDLVGPTVPPAAKTDNQ